MTLDRAVARRADPQWLAEARTAPGARALLFWRDRCLSVDGVPVTGEVPEDPESTVFLGVDRAPLFAVDLCGAGQLPGTPTDIRALFPRLSTEDSARLAYARGMLHWHRGQRFCGACGRETAARNGGHLRVCRGCAKEHYPRIEPAVIALVEYGDRCLLARHAGAADFATLAGFVEVGESLEEAVRREVAEETGVLVGQLRYQGSQPWTSPAGLVVGFRAVALDPTVAVDGLELAEARWFTRDEVAAMDSRPDSVEAALLAAWLDDA